MYIYLNSEFKAYTLYEAKSVNSQGEALIVHALWHSRFVQVLFKHVLIINYMSKFRIFRNFDEKTLISD